jgi:nucleotide-binding universal stress UspA family protein
VYQRILVAVDGSETSSLALDHAVQLAKDQRARLCVTHVVEALRYMASSANAYPFDPTPVLESLREDGRQLLLAAESKARAAGVEVEAALLEERDLEQRVATIVLAQAQHWDADLIVLGTHGRRGFDRLFLGSAAETLVRLATLPVLLIRAKPK